MQISNIILRLSLAASLLMPLHADELTLKPSGARLTGTVNAISEAGVLELTSPLSPSPLLFKNGAVTKVIFSPAQNLAEIPTTLLELENGDLLPANLISLDEQNLVVNSPDAGRLTIPRDSLRSMQLGISPHRLIYSGPINQDEWTVTDDEKGWSFERGTLVANGPASVSKKIALPQQFILRFTLKWSEGQSPNFQIYFADPLLPMGEPCDRYFMRFSNVGLDVRREASTGSKRYTELIRLNRTPNQYPNGRVKMEIRADRKTARFQLFLNDEPETPFIDVVPSVPTASGMILSSTANSGTTLSISNIEVLEYNDARDRHRSESRGNTKQDSLISRDDDRWGGHLSEIRKSGQETIFVFKSDFQNAPLEIPETEVSTVFFAKNIEKSITTAEQPPIILRLRGEGSLHVTSCRFADDSVFTVHPLLGPLKLPRAGIVTMEHTESKPPSAPEP